MKTIIQVGVKNEILCRVDDEMILRVSFFQIRGDSMFESEQHYNLYEFLCSVNMGNTQSDVMKVQIPWCDAPRYLLYEDVATAFGHLVESRYKVEKGLCRAILLCAMSLYGWIWWRGEFQQGK